MIPQAGMYSQASFSAWQSKSPHLYAIADSLRLNRVFSSYWFLALVLLLSSALSITCRQQFGKALALFRRPPYPLAPDMVVNIPPSFLPALEETVRKKGFVLTMRGEGEEVSSLWSKHQWGVWGSFILHVGLLIIILGSLYTFAFQKWGFVQLIEGDTFSGRGADFISQSRGVLADPFEPGFQLHLKKFTHDYWDTGELKELRSEVVISEGTAERHLPVIKGEPVAANRVKIYQSGYFGYTVKLSLMEGEKEAVPSYFSLDMTMKGKPLVGRSDFPTTAYICDFSLRPDQTGNSLYPRDPLLQVRFFKDGREIHKAVFALGEETIVEGKRFRFVEIRNWSGFFLTENRMLLLVYIGFFLSMAGIFVVYLFSPQAVYLSFAKGNDGALILSATVSCRRGKSLLLEELREAIIRFQV
jgi:cytochrome c biogenesis protein